MMNDFQFFLTWLPEHPVAGFFLGVVIIVCFACFSECRLFTVEITNQELEREYESEGGTQQ